MAYFVYLLLLGELMFTYFMYTCDILRTHALSVTSSVRMELSDCPFSPPQVDLFSISTNSSWLA